MPKTSLEKALEKQLQGQKRIAENQKRLAEKQAREEKERAIEVEIDSKARSIVGNAKSINGFIIMDGEAEQFLQIILQKAEQLIQNGKDTNSLIGVRVDDIPEHLQRSFGLQLKKLEHYGMISGVVNFTYFAHLTVTPEGLGYFTEKEKAMSLPAFAPQHSSRKEYDVFISHASKDKEEYVDSLYGTLRTLGIKIFYDTETISWGDNLKETILNGTEQSEFAIIVISKNFFSREWTELELREFLSQQNENGQKIILPLLHNITIEELKDHYPELGEVLAINSADYSKQEIAILLAKELIKRYR